MYDTVVYKDIKSMVFQKGERQEFRYKSPYAGKVNIRIGTNNPIEVSITGPHIERTEVSGTKTYSFTADPGTEFFIAIQNKTGFFVKPADVTVEVEILGPKKAVEVMNKIKNLQQLLRESPEFYEIQKDAVKDILKEVTEIWNLIDDEQKQIVKELVALTKKLEGSS